MGTTSSVIEKKQTERIIWIDYAKLISIFLVIFGHIPLTDGFFSDEITTLFKSFRMPLFFFVSGMLDKGNAVGISLRKNIKSLMIPYCIIYLLTYAWWVVIIFPSHPNLYEQTFFGGFVRPMLGMLVGEITGMEYSVMSNPPLWFLLGLFFCRTFFSLALAAGKKIPFGLLLANIVAILFTVWFRSTGKNLFFSIDSAIMVLPFYTAGYLLKNKLIHIKIKKRVSFLLSALFLLVLWFTCQMNEIVSIGRFIYGNNIFLFYINGLLGTFGMLLLCKTFAYKNRFLLYLSANTLIILGFHGIMITFVKTGYLFLISAPSFANIKITVPEAFCVSIITLFLSVIPIYIIRKYFPFIIGKKKREIQPIIYSNPGKIQIGNNK